MGEGGTTEDQTNSGVVAFTRKHLRIGRNVFEYEIMSWKEGMIEIQFWMDSGRLAEGVLFLVDGVLSFHFLAGDEYHYFVMHRQDDKYTSSGAHGSQTYGRTPLSP